ncbi:MAG: HAD-IIB family hydrolase [Candidatus Thiodiazotropha sp.]
MSNGWLVFTDLDGTLLDHHTYDATPALPALDWLRESGVPIIPVSSKTLAELEDLKHQLNFDGPIVAENGAVLAYPGEEPQIAPPGYHLIRDFLIDHRANPHYDNLGFGDMSLEEVMQQTGLQRPQAEAARKRLASEPFLWRGTEDDLAGFRYEVKKAGLRLTRGGRFLHLLGDTDKGMAVKLVIKHLQGQGYPVTHSIALGDSENDRDMLLAVDHPVIVRKPNGTYLDLPERADALRTEQPGPEGWKQAIFSLRDRLERG